MPAANVMPAANLIGEEVVARHTELHSPAVRLCSVCGSTDVVPAVPSSRPNLTPDDFKITDAGYGRTGPLYSCRSCGFRYVVFPEDALQYYQAMKDPEYEEGRAYRSVQQQRLIRRLRAALPDTRTILDVGAGTGMLVEEAARQGLDGVGVEPSRWFAEVAQRRGLNVLEGALPHPALKDRMFDAGTIVDVIEHVADPVGLLKVCAASVRPGGGVLVVTPDAGSLTARLMGRRWWHYRMAHVGYFDLKTLRLALAKAGLVPVMISRASWFFEVAYLYARLRRYLPLPALERSRVRAVSRLLAIQVPLNLGDSLEIIARKERRRSPRPQRRSVLWSAQHWTQRGTARLLRLFRLSLSRLSA